MNNSASTLFAFYPFNYNNGTDRCLMFPHWSCKHVLTCAMLHACYNSTAASLKTPLTLTGLLNFLFICMIASCILSFKCLCVYVCAWHVCAWSTTFVCFSIFIPRSHMTPPLPLLLWAVSQHTLCWVVYRDFPFSHVCYNISLLLYPSLHTS